MDFEYVECPRDAMQGIKELIPTDNKIAYLKALLDTGFDVIDCGSFVSPTAVPQMADTAQLLNAVVDYQHRSKLLVIIANLRGAIRACAYPNINFLGYPFSVSETFQKRNTNSTRENAFIELSKIQQVASVTNREVVAYISMGFGNPYGESYSIDLVSQWSEKIHKLGISTISLADTTSQASPELIFQVFNRLKMEFPKVKFGAHFHAPVENWKEKLDAAITAGCRRFDGAILGFGGCPFAKDQMVGNIPTEQVLKYLRKKYNFDKIEITNELIQLAQKTYNYKR